MAIIKFKETKSNDFGEWYLFAVYFISLYLNCPLKIKETKRNDFTSDVYFILSLVFYPILCQLISVHLEFDEMKHYFDEWIYFFI